MSFRSDIISIHALREEGDKSARSFLRLLMNFYPRPPRGGRHAGLDYDPIIDIISIHALREEGDSGSNAIYIERQKFLSTPSARRATLQVIPVTATGLFLSTPSARRATSRWRSSLCGPLYFYPRPPRGGRRSGKGEQRGNHKYFYPRPPRGGRPFPCGIGDDYELFLSTPSARRATGEKFSGITDYPFLSTPSARRATVVEKAVTWCKLGISIHALREEGDLFNHSDYTDE